MPTKSPLAVMNEKFGDKAKLVASLEKLTNEDLWVSRTNKDKGLAHVSNAKLLRLHALFSEVKEKFGTREKLVDAILELQKRTKDVGLRQKLLTWPVPRLYDTYRSTSKRLGVTPKSAAATAKAPAKAKAVGGAPAPKKAKASAAKTGAKKSAAAKKTPKKGKKGSR